MHARAGLHDPRVGYWVRCRYLYAVLSACAAAIARLTDGIAACPHLQEPAKYVAKLREYKTDDNMLLFKCDMGAGTSLATVCDVDLRAW